MSDAYAAGSAAAVDPVGDADAGSRVRSLQDMDNSCRQSEGEGMDPSQINSFGSFQGSGDVLPQEQN